MNETPNITLNPVKSGQIQAIGHDANTNTLAIQFKGGGVYHYAGVDAESYKAFSGADSLGKHLASNIKGKYEFTKIPAKKDQEK